MSYKITKYHKGLQSQWNDFIDRSDKGTFLHRRAYMDYHAGRFDDFSLLIYKDDKLIAILPAHRHNDTLIAHNGLTYSDFIYDKKLRIEGQISVMTETFAFLKSQGFTDFMVKTIPAFFHKQPNESNLYLYQRMQGELTEVKPFFVLHTQAFQLNKDRKKNLKRLQKQALFIKDDIKYLQDYWVIVNQNLAKTYQSKPVHSFDEIDALSKKFPNQIKLFSIFDQTQILGGALVFLINNVVHFQYINAHPDYDKSAIDLLIFNIIERYKQDYQTISFGSSSTGHQNLNAGLAYWKESFGCKILNQYFYRLKIDNYKLLNAILQ